MSINEWVPILCCLDRADKLYIMQLMNQEIAKEEDALFSSNSHAIWSPYASFEAANVLLEELNLEANL